MQLCVKRWPSRSAHGRRHRTPAVAGITVLSHCAPQRTTAGGESIRAAAPLTVSLRPKSSCVTQWCAKRWPSRSAHGRRHRIPAVAGITVSSHCAPPRTDAGGESIRAAARLKRLLGLRRDWRPISRCTRCRSTTQRLFLRCECGERNLGILLQGMYCTAEFAHAEPAGYISGMPLPQCVLAGKASSQYLSSPRVPRTALPSPSPAVARGAYRGVPVSPRHVLCLLLWRIGRKQPRGRLRRSVRI
jgi:hypothetical protein